MKLLGALLALGGAAGFCIQRRRYGLLPVQIAQALLRDLTVLRCQICLRRASLPQILEESLTGGPGAQRLWMPLSRTLQEQGERGVPRCWTEAVQTLPPPLGSLLEPLGPILPQGGRELEAAIEETREALRAYVQAETVRQADRGRVTAALCLAGVCLAVLVFI